MLIARISNCLSSERIGPFGICPTLNRVKFILGKDKEGTGYHILLL